MNLNKGQVKGQGAWNKQPSAFFTMKRISLFLIILLSTTLIFSQEALKSLEEEYYDFMALQGLVERPTLGYRTLSDSVWNFVPQTEMMENDDGTFTKVNIAGQDSEKNVWKNNNLGTTWTLWNATEDGKGTNWFTRGFYNGLKAKVYGPEWFNSYNTAVPYGQNDGGLWQGRGYNSSLTGGIRFEGFGFEATFKPQISFSENREFTTLENKYITSWDTTGNIDVVQRYGDSSFWNFDWGDTEIRWTWHSFTVGFGTQSPWLGPAYLNPMLGSNNAGSYPKVDIGLRKTEIIIPGINLDLGAIEGRVWTGMLKQSEYFTGYAYYSNENRMLNALSASYSPSFIPGFTIGLNRIFMTYWRPENFSYILRLFTKEKLNALASSGNDEDQKFSVFAFWSINPIGLKIFGEYGIDDFSSNYESNPFHTAIFTFGAQQKIPLFSFFSSEIDFEFNFFEMSQDFQFECPYMGYYAHGFINQGYTNKGQIIGAGSGSFGNSQFLQYKIYFPLGNTILRFHRFTPNINSVYSKAVYDTADTAKSNLHDLWLDNFESYFTYAIISTFCIYKDFYVTFALENNTSFGYNFNKNINKENWKFELQLKYNF